MNTWECPRCRRIHSILVSTCGCPAPMVLASTTTDLELCTICNTMKHCSNGVCGRCKPEEEKKQCSLCKNSAISTAFGALCKTHFDSEVKSGARRFVQEKKQECCEKCKGFLHSHPDKPNAVIDEMYKTCPCHSPAPTEDYNLDGEVVKNGYIGKLTHINGVPSTPDTQVSEWKKQLNEMFTDVAIHHEGIPCFHDALRVGNIERFIQDLLASQRKQLLDEIEREMGEYGGDSKPHDDTRELHEAIAWQEGYNSLWQKMKGVISKLR